MERLSIDKLMAQVGYSAEDIRGLAQPVGKERTKSDLTAFLQAIKEERQQRSWAVRLRLNIRSAEANA